MSKLYIFLLLFSSFSLHANLNFNSNTITFNAKKVTLDGDVKLDHDFGSIECEQAEIYYEGYLQNAKKIVLSKKVKLDIPQKCTFFSDKAEIDLLLKKASFSSSEKPVCCLFYKQEKIKYPLPVIKAEKIYLFFNSLNKIEKMIASGDVVMDEKKYVITGDQAIYDDTESIAIVPGKVVLMDHLDKEIVTLESSKLLLNTNQKKMLMQNAYGQIDMHELPISFKADELIYDDKNEKLELLKNIEIKHEEFFVFNDSSVKILMEKKQVKNIVLNGTTTFKHLLKGGIPSYSLVSDGNLLLDPIKMQIVSKKNSQQIQFKDQVGQVFGDFLTIDYEKNKDKVSLKKIILENEVKLINGLEENKGDISAALKYALADKMEYICDTQKIGLFSNINNRVLFFDSSNNFEMSAEGLNYEKGKFSGIGTVRFHFLPKEIKEIKNKFKF